jgi:3-deoxy-D-manno-octulosonic acid kinase
VAFLTPQAALIRIIDPMEPPQGFERVEHEGAVLVLREGLAPALLEAGVADPVGLVEAQPTEHAGRGKLARVELEGGPALVRPLLRGGLLGKLIRRLSFDPWRSVAELAVSAEAAARGASVLDVLAAVTRRVGLGFQHGLVTREVTGARDLMGALKDARGRERAAALRAAGDAVRALHDAGVDHVDLNLKNVLLRPDGRALVIDLDRCRIGRLDLSWERRRSNLLRLLRSWVKLGSVHPGRVHPRDPLRLARAYARGDRELRRRLVRAGRGARFPLRRLLWRLFPPRIP